MAVHMTNTFEGLAPTGAATSSNQNADGISGDAMTLANSGGTNVCTQVAGEVIGGGKSLKVTSPAGGQVANWMWTLATGAAIASAGGRLRARFLDALPVGGQVTLLGFRATNAAGDGSSSPCVDVDVQADGKIALSTPGGKLFTTTGALTPGEVFQIDVTVQPGTTTSNGKVKFAVYNAAGALHLGMSAPYEKVDANVSTYGVKRFQTGWFGNGTPGTGTVILDDCEFVEGYALVGPVVQGVDDARPVAVVAAGGWTPVGAADVAAALADNDDATFAVSPDGPTDAVMKVGLATLNAGSVNVPFSYWATAASPPRRLLVELRDRSGALIASKTIASVTSTTPVNDVLTLSPAENAAFTDRITPQLWFTAN